MKQKILNKAKQLHNLDFTKKLYAYLVIGIIGVVVDTLFTNIFYNLVFLNIFSPNTTIEENSLKTISAIIGAAAGLVNNFLFNEFFVYKIKNGRAKSFIRFLIYSTTIILSSFIFGKIIVLNIALIFLEGTGFGLTTANIIAIASGTVINYPVNYFLTWKKKKD